MTRRRCAVLALALLAVPAAAGEIRGTARVTDGDTLAIGAAHVRLHGIDAQLWVPDSEALRANLAQELNRARRYGGSVGLTLIRLDCAPVLRVRYGAFYTDHLLRRIGAFLGLSAPSSAPTPARLRSAAR